MFNEIQAAMQRLADGYQRNDAAAIEEATDALTKMGHAKVALAALPEAKRLAVILLHRGITQWNWERTLSTEEIADVLCLPKSVVIAVLDARDAKEQRLLDEDKAQNDAAVAAGRAALREVTRTTACPRCGAPPGSACVSTTGKKRSMHGERRGDVPHVDAGYMPPDPYDPVDWYLGLGERRGGAR